MRPSLSDYLDLYDAAAEGIRHKTTMANGEAFHTGIVGKSITIDESICDHVTMARN